MSRTEWHPVFADYGRGLRVEILGGTTFTASLHIGRGGVLIDDKEVVVGSEGENWRVVRLEDGPLVRGSA